MVLSAKSKANKRERRQKAELSSLIKGMTGVVVVCTLLSMLLAYLFFIIQPVLLKWVVGLFTKTNTKSQFLKEDLDIGTFQKFYYQSYPVVIPSIHHNQNIDLILNQSYCGEVDENTGAQECRSIGHEFCRVLPDDKASEEFVYMAENIFCGPVMSLEALSTPRVRGHMPNVYEDIASFDGPADFVLSRSIYGTSPRPTFKQYPQMWEYLMLGRKVWFLYRPAGVPIQGFNPKKPLQDWLENVYPKLSEKERPIEFVQEEGQTVYIPEGWYQASLPLPHPLVPLNPPPLHTLLWSIANSAACNSDAPDTICIEDTNITSAVSESSDIFTLSVRQQSKTAEVNTSLFYLTETGERLLANGKIKEAVQFLREAVKGKDDFRSFHLLGKSLVADGNIEEAEKYLRFAIIANRLNVAPHVDLIELMLNTKRYDQAELAVKAAIALGFEDCEELNTFKYIFNIR